MKSIYVVLFFSIFFAVYGLLNLYIFFRGWQSLPPLTWVRYLYVFIFITFSLSFICGRLLERVWMNPLSGTLVWIGSFWLGAMLYFLLAILVLDILRLSNVLFSWFPSFVTSGYAAFKVYLAGGITVLISLLLSVGYVNASHPRIHRMTITIAKRLEGSDVMTIAVASDIHLGTLIGRTRLRHIVDTINGLEPDVVLMPGDIVDEDLRPVIKQNLGETLREIGAPLGVFAVTGNHEYIGGAEAACAYLTAHGVTFLRDSIVRLANGLIVAGREDRSIRQFSGGKRKELSELLAGVDSSLPIVLMDHQPFGLHEAAECHVDLQLSGHTHDGQLWPLTYITRAVYEVSWGFLRINRTHFYVSSGVGTWGPPVRIGNRPEIVLVTLVCEGNNGDDMLSQQPSPGR
jgi:predicted MPP superfamily phosphohydrolase